MVCLTRLRRRSVVRRMVASAALAAACWLMAIYGLRQPSNDRDWEFGFERVPSVAIADDILTIRNVRDYRIDSDGSVRPHFVDRSFRRDAVERAWFLVEPFSALPIMGYQGIAHTYFVFDISGEPPIAVSVEARRERSERFDLGLGLISQYELMYIWAGEEDVTVKRVMDQHNEVFMYPLFVPRETVVELVTQLATTTAALEHQPRFYNSLTGNCTSELARAANAIRPGAIPLHVGWWMPGLAVDQLYDLGYIPHDRPLPEIRQRYRVTEIVRQIHGQLDFSERLRDYLRDQ